MGLIIHPDNNLFSFFFFWRGWGSFPGGSVINNLSANAGDVGSIPGSGRSPGEENGNPLQYSCLENSIDRGAWLATVHEVTELNTTKHLAHNDKIIPSQWCPWPYPRQLCLCLLPYMAKVTLQVWLYQWFSKTNFYWHIGDIKCLVSTVQQSESVIHIHISTLFKILSPYRSLQSAE